MSTRVLIGAAVIVVVASALVGAAMQDATDSAPAQEAPLARVEFLAGHWHGRMGDGVMEEYWSRPRGDAMVGTFRWVGGDGATRLVEILTLTDHGEDGVVLRLRHYDVALKPWPEEIDPVTMRLEEAKPGLARFVAMAGGDVEGIDYEIKDGKLVASINFAAATQRDPLVLTFERGEP